MVWKRALPALLLIVSLVQAAQAQIARSDHHVESDPGIRIYVREVVDPEAADPSRPPVLLLHGARVPGVASFDLPVCPAARSPRTWRGWGTPST